MTNVNPDTGIRYGVIALQSLDSDTADELMHGSGAVDDSYQEAHDQAKADAGREFDDGVEEADIAAAEIDGGMSDEARETYTNNWIEAKFGRSDREDFIEGKLEEFSDMCQIEEPSLHGELEGVKYQIGWLGGAPLLWVIEGPIGWANRLCSPCVPNAADLDGGFDTGEVGEECTVHTCYVVPRDWLRQEVLA